MHVELKLEVGQYLCPPHDKQLLFICCCASAYACTESTATGALCLGGAMLTRPMLRESVLRRCA